jgi:hypothetical protein
MKYKCHFDKCNKEYVKKQSLKIHLDKVHYYKEKKELKEYICDKCFSYFNSRQSLHYHIHKSKCSFLTSINDFEEEGNKQENETNIIKNISKEEKIIDNLENIKKMDYIVNDNVDEKIKAFPLNTESKGGQNIMINKNSDYDSGIETKNKLDCLEENSKIIKDIEIEFKDKINENLYNSLINQLNKITENLKNLKNNDNTTTINITNNNTINNNTINNNTINNIINNNINNNFIILIEPTSENVEELLTENEIINILKNKDNCLEKLISKIHFNKKIPQCCNFYVKDIIRNNVYKYSDTHKKFIFDKLNNFIKEISDHHIEDLDSLSEDYYKTKKKIGKKRHKNIQNVVNEYKKKSEFYKKKINNIKTLVRQNINFPKQLKEINPEVFE